MKPFALRLLAVAAITLFILVPLQLIAHKVQERQARAESVIADFARETSGPQSLAGPFLAVTCTYASGEACPTRYFAPQSLEADVALAVESRRRGIYPIRLFTATIRTSTTFDWPPLSGKETRWGEAFLVWSIRDPRGIKAFSSADGAPVTGDAGQVFEGFPLRQAVGPAGARSGRAAFQHEATITGTASFELAPIGDRTQLHVTSNWPHPAFTRGHSPDQREVTASGFQATWHTNSLGTGGGIAWVRAASEGKLLAAHSAGVQLFEPINVYSLSYRAIEYGFLFILFTFTAFALTEVLAGIQLHPVQYALVGAALAVFFLLLLALSEHIRFDAAYGMASASCVALITAYLRPVLPSPAAIAGSCALFAAMYATLYVLLRSEDHALLIGSALSFALLATVMLTTRRIDWKQWTLYRADSHSKAEA